MASTSSENPQDPRNLPVPANAELTPDSAPVAELEYEHTAAENWVREHKKQLIMLATVVGLGFLGYHSLKFYREAAASKASQAYGAANTLDGFREVAKSFAGSNSGGSAAFMAASMELEDKSFEKARKSLEEFVSAYPQHELATSAKFRIAETLLGEKKADEALAKFREFIANNPTSHLTEHAIKRVGDLLAEQGKKDEAKAEYEKLKKPGNEGSEDEVKRLVEALELEAPVKIPFKEDPPPAAAGTPTPGAPNTDISAPSLTPGATAPSLSTDLSVPALDAPAPTVPSLDPKPAEPTPAPK
jgi:predicted negative regulator of RcsB-dependent stress response